MLVNIHHDSPAEHRRLLLAGVVFLTAMAALVYLSVAIYQKKFDTVTMVTVKADRAGLQLAKFGDVRLNGALIGQVRSVEQDGAMASIEVALEPEAAQEITEDVRVQILPTTLFGQKFLSFIPSEQQSGRPLSDGSVIPAGQVETNVELSEILANLFPLLRAVRPADLNSTLNALATALEGRGDQLGDTIEELDSYLGAIDDSLPTLRQDLVELAAVADTYDLAAPDLIGVLRNLTVTSKTIVAKRQELDVFFTDVAGLSETTTRILADNESDLIRIGEVTQPVLKLLEIYSPEFPCLIKGAARYRPLLAKTFEGNQVKQFIEFGTAQYQAYDQSDLPEYGEVGHGPWCSGLPFPPVPIGPNSFDDGADLDDNPPSSALPILPIPGLSKAAAAAGFGSGMSSGYAGSQAEQSVVNALLAGRSGRAADSYGALGSLLYAPVVRGGGA
ncbi:ABC transporter substrate-binding protein [Nocardioides psychrotolerans]|uniref:Phospholipid/cholesterol/gamma-HCH transport system substrate-binding protein n=1 Tax=Nocardioides psychrotolerans TaxID=1005945 RepID=A0A1I3FWT9_9ACTN|nr:MCE family protein [Nocardioides psychrotolerans]GEP37339.1 ABC transporter substrate-binding protein [Nocardioides psychrotolerans]SFI15381.1 phospholipid/cholesterol/gamma-HCH transport system substrate-binding protein [Nocardioides psychrotolerans]